VHNNLNNFQAKRTHAVVAINDTASIRCGRSVRGITYDIYPVSFVSMAYLCSIASISAY